MKRSTIDGRLIITPPAKGAWNMGADETLLEHAAIWSGHSDGSRSAATTASGHGVTGPQWPTLRFYRWAEPTLSLGYFQAVGDRATHRASRACPVVRRQSGGGAILHDQEWTYCLVMPAGSPLVVDAMALYRSVHDALIAALAEQGVAARLCSSVAKRERVEPFLCFQRRAQGDVLIESPRAGDSLAKIAGSAQRRRRGALLQHGSLILRTSPAAPEIAGLRELIGRDVDEERLRLAWQTGIAQRLRLHLRESELSTAEQALSSRLAAEKYAAPEWNEKR